jgi:hypothetical protein
VLAGNWEWAMTALRLIKPRVARTLSVDETLDTPEKRADAVLAAVESIKGRFAQALTRTIADIRGAGHAIVVPQYIRDAIEFVSEEPDRPVGVTNRDVRAIDKEAQLPSRITEPEGMV